MGPHPESFLGLHASTSDPLNHERLLPYLIDWDSDRILEQSQAFLQVADEGLPHPVRCPPRARDRTHVRADAR